MFGDSLSLRPQVMVGVCSRGALFGRHDWFVLTALGTRQSTVSPRRRAVVACWSSVVASAVVPCAFSLSVVAGGEISKLNFKMMFYIDVNVGISINYFKMSLIYDLKMVCPSYVRRTPLSEFKFRLFGAR